MFKNIQTLNLGSLPILIELCKIAKIKEIVNNMVQWNDSNSKISPGFLIETLVVCILSGRQPLWKINEFWEVHNIQTLYNDFSISPKQFNDDAYGRALDKLSAIKMEELVSNICLTMLKAHNEVIQTIHFDTTSKSVQGAYESSPKGDFDITYGHSKDHRPDLKQFKIGAAVQQNNLPIMGQLLSGKTSDSKWNPEAIKAMKSFFKEHGFKDITFIGDSATVSSYENLRNLSNINFISRFPETFSLTKELKKGAFLNDDWHVIGKISDKKDAAEYKIKSYIREIENVPYRFVVVHSSQLESKKRHTITKKILKDKEKLSKEAKKLSKRKFACLEDAKIEEEKFINKLRSSKFQYTSEIVKKESVKYGKRGKPSKDSIGTSVISYYVSINIEDYDEDAFNELLMFESSFVLITSILDSSRYSNEEILKEYKNQNSIERAFRFLKSPVYLGPIFLKKKERIEALGYVFIIVLMIASYLEYRVRKSINQNNEYLLEPNGSKNTNPSVKRILEILGYINILIVDGQSFFPSNIDQRIIKMIEWTGFDLSIYLNPS